MKKLSWKYAEIVVSAFILGLGVFLSTQISQVPQKDRAFHWGPFSPQLLLNNPLLNTIFTTLTQSKPIPQTQQEKTQDTLVLTPTAPFQPLEAIKKSIATTQAQQNEALKNLANATEKLSEDERRKIQSGLLTISRNRTWFQPFIASLPVDIQPAAKAYVESTFELQDHYLALDGITRDFLKPHEVAESKSLSEHAEKIRAAEMSPQVRTHIEEISQTENIRESDVQKLIQLCERKRPCVERGIVAWMDSHHLFNESQIDLIEKSLTSSGEGL